MNFLNSEDAENYFYKFYQKISDEITLQIYSPKGSDKRFGRIIASGIKDANPGATVSAKSLAKSFATLNSDDHNHPGKNYGNIRIGYGPSDPDRAYAKKLIKLFSHQSNPPEFYVNRKGVRTRYNEKGKIE